MKHKAKKKIKLNRHTGQPRKWVCHNHGAVDGYLEEIEEMYFYSFKGARKGTVGWESHPRESLERLIVSLQSRLEWMCATLKSKTNATLSEAEIRYCYLEGIELADFLKAKHI